MTRRTTRKNRPELAPERRSRRCWAKHTSNGEIDALAALYGRSEEGTEVVEGDGERGKDDVSTA